MDYKKLFEEAGYTTAPDKTLCALLDQSLTFMSETDLASYIKCAQRFNQKPTHITESYPGEFLLAGTNEVVYQYRLRKELEQFPAFFDMARKSQLTDKQAAHLLLSLIKAEQYDFVYVSDHIEVMTDVMEICIEKGFSFKNSLPALKKLLSVARREGELGRGLKTMRVGIRAGMTPEHSTGIVEYIYKKSAIPGYAFGALYEELDLLATNNVDENLLYKTLKIAMGKDPCYSQGNFRMLTEIFHLAATHTSLSQEDILKKIVSRNRKNLPSASALTPMTKSGEIIKSEYKDRNAYFPEINTKKVITGLLPYRVTKDFIGGIADLKESMKIGFQEGAYVFDPNQKTWFSFGGRTDLKPGGGLRHDFFMYDISKLSEKPVFVHMHPERAEIMIGPPRESLAYTQMQKKLTKFLAAMPSGADYKMCAEMIRLSSGKINLRSVIVTSLGLTQMVIPANANAIEELGNRFQTLKDQVMLEFDATGYIANGEENEDEFAFVQRLLTHVNKKLPAGFIISMQSYETNPTPLPSLLLTSPRKLNI